MGILILSVLIIMFSSKLIEEKLKIPFTLSVIFFAFIVKYFFSIEEIKNINFDTLLITLIPLILLPDILSIHYKELKRYWKQVFFLAFVSIIISIFLIYLIFPYILPEYKIGIGGIIAFSSILLVTDAITVTSILKNIQVPEKLKFYAEAESLFNDVTGILLFYIIALPMIISGNVDIQIITLSTLKVIFGSFFIGLGIGGIGYYLMKFTDDYLNELVLFLIISFSSFIFAEHFHFSGILSIVISLITFQFLFIRRTERNNIPTKNILNFSLFSKYATTKQKIDENIEIMNIFSNFANAFLFTSMAFLIDLDKILKYSNIIIVIFILLTLIRFFMMYLFTKFDKKKFNWSIILTFGGIKGALGILMVHALPNSFEYKEMFEAVIFGNILLSTYLYSIILIYSAKKIK